MSFPGFSIIKDKVIKPLLVATEKVVEYYFPENEEESISKEEEKDKSKNPNRNSMTGTSKTTNDSLSETFHDCNKIKKRFKKLTVNS